MAPREEGVWLKVTEGGRGERGERERRPTEEARAGAADSGSLRGWGVFEDGIAIALLAKLLMFLARARAPRREVAVD